ncbi:MAG: hypothetical protein PVI15_04035 [Chromatiales bacterium]
MTGLLKLTLKLVGWVLGVLVLLLGGGAAYLLMQVAEAPDIEARKGELAAVEPLGTRRLPDGMLHELRLHSTAGFSLGLALRVPDEPLPGRPLAVMMVGNETGEAAATMLPETEGLTIAALGYPFEVIPHRNMFAFTASLPQIQRGILDTPSAVLLALDYLLSRDDLTPEWTELVGISFGAFLVSVPGALDTRVDRVWLVHGSADAAAVLEYGLEDRVAWPWLRRGFADFLAQVAGNGHFSPESWVGRISPRPVIVVSALEDRALPPAAVAALHEAARPPREVIWTEGDHVHPKRPETVENLARLVLDKVKEAVRGGSGAVRPDALGSWRHHSPDERAS